MKKFKVGDVVYAYSIYPWGDASIKRGEVRFLDGYIAFIRFRQVDETAMLVESCFHTFREAAEAMIEAYCESKDV